MNISSVIVYSQPEQMAALRAHLATLPGAEVHGVTPDGKLVVSIEADNATEAAATFESIERAPGVLSVALVFQQTESNPDQELAPCK